MKKIVSLLLAAMIAVLACTAYAADSWECYCGKKNYANFCTDCGLSEEESAAKIEEEKSKELIGTTFEFGHYPQTASESDSTPIEWIGIDCNNEGLLLLSKFCLDQVVYYEEEQDGITWSNCALREWLNQEFFNRAFELSDQMKIMDFYHTNEDNPYYNIEGGSDTTDKVFCLSLNEYYALVNEEFAKGIPTEYAKMRGVEVYNNRNCPWWLRTIGGTPHQAAFIWVNKDKNGELIVYGGGTEMWNRGIAVRPAIWVYKKYFLE